MTEAAAPPTRRPAVITIAVVFVYIAGFLDVGAGLLILLTRYHVPGDAVLPVSLLGAGTILFGLLSIAIGSGIARGSRLARLLITIYAAARLALHVATIVSTDWDWAVIVQLVADAFILLVLWVPPGRRFFRRDVPVARP